MKREQSKIYYTENGICLPEQVRSLTEFVPQRIQELFCISCHLRFIAIYPTTVKLIDMQCPVCNYSGYLIGTGCQASIQEDYND